MIDKTGFWDKEFAPQHHVHIQKVSDWIMDFLKNEKETQIYDFGCGMGTYLEDLNKDGFKNLIGIEADPPKDDYSFEIQKRNLANAFTLDKKGIIVSLEVGEHIPEEYQDTFLDNIANNCEKFLILSWAIRGQGGVGHFNERDNAEIIPLVEKRGFKLMLPETDAARTASGGGYFSRTLMIFRKVEIVSKPTLKKQDNTDVTFVLTACNRPDLLEKTIDSFLKHNTYPITKYIITEDSQIKNVNDKLKEKYKELNIEWIENEVNQGVLGSLDIAYSKVKTDWVFHCEDDWEFLKGGFIEASFDVMLDKPKIIQAHIRGENDIMGHPVLPVTFKGRNERAYKILSNNYGKSGLFNGYMGYSLNPGLRRLYDYLVVAPYKQYGGEPWINQEYNKLNYMGATLIDQYVTHIGYGRSTVGH